MRTTFRDRIDAGRRLARRLRGIVEPDALILGLPRGGVPVAWEVARATGAELDVLVVRKIGAPGSPEYALGALAAGVDAIDVDAAVARGYPREEIERTIERERAEVSRRERDYRGDVPPPQVEGRVVVVVDDGVATGSTAIAALRALRAKRPRRLVFATPVATRSGLAAIRQEADDAIAIETPPDLHAVSQGYAVFGQTDDDEVRHILQRARGGAADEVRIPVADAVLDGVLSRPPTAWALVVFAHGSGSGRNSPRNRAVARAFNDAGIATLLVDLLAADEARRDEIDASYRFDIDLLAHRVEGVVDWTAEDERVAPLPVALYGSSTGAAAALRAAAREPVRVRAVVSRGGRVDLASGQLGMVHAPTLLIVGSADAGVLDLNRSAVDRLAGTSKLSLVEGAGHLFEAPGELEEVARLAIEWLRDHLGAVVGFKRSP